MPKQVLNAETRQEKMGLQFIPVIEYTLTLPRFSDPVSFNSSWKLLLHFCQTSLPSNLNQGNISRIRHGFCYDFSHPNLVDCIEMPVVGQQQKFCIKRFASVIFVVSLPMYTLVWNTVPIKQQNLKHNQLF